MVRRRGVTLVEVLAAIFIMGIGLLALLTLFPLGALSMSNSVRDNNAAAAGSAALGIAQSFNLRNDPNLLLAMQSPPSVTIGTNTISGLPIQPNGPGYPVYVDPTYAIFSNNIGFIQPAIAGLSPTTPGIKRIAPFFNNYSALAAKAKLPKLTDRFFTYLDDINFDANGMPADPSGAPANPNNVAQQIDRPGSLSWGYMIRPGRRGANQASITSPASLLPGASGTFFDQVDEMSIVVYRARPVNSPLGETPYSASGIASSTSLTLFYNTVLPPTGVPDLRIGDFILDTTFDIVPDPNNNNNQFGSVHGYFYKIVDFIDSPTTKSMTLTLATPLRAPVVSTIGGAPSPTQMGQVVHLKYVVDVQERGIGAKP